MLSKTVTDTGGIRHREGEKKPRESFFTQQIPETRDKRIKGKG